MLAQVVMAVLVQVTERVQLVTAQVPHMALELLDMVRQGMAHLAMVPPRGMDLELTVATNVCRYLVLGFESIPFYCETYARL